MKKTKKQDKIKKLEEELSQKFSEMMKLPEVDKKKKNEEIKMLMPYYLEMTDKVENRRIGIHAFSVQLLLALIAVIAYLLTHVKLTMKFSLSQWVGYPLIGMALVLIIGCIFINICYIRQSKFRYAFLNLKGFGNRWKWFYYGNPNITKINTKCASVEDGEHYLEGMIYFADNYAKETLDKEIEDNLQQLFLLQVHNYYKNQFYLKLTRIAHCAIKIVFLVPIIVLCFMVGHLYLSS